MSRLKELSESELRILAGAACNIRLIPKEIRAAINHVLELANAEGKPKPKYKAGDKVLFGEVGRPMLSGVVTEICSGGYTVFGRDEIYHENVPEEALSRDYGLTADGKPSETDNENRDSNGCSSFLDMPYHEVQRMELAKAVAIAYAEKGRYEPSEIGAKAVEVANGVVEQLKNNKQW